MAIFIKIFFIFRQIINRPEELERGPGKRNKAKTKRQCGVSEGFRTPNPWSHSPVLCP
jgi:hypothetical protein